MDDADGLYISALTVIADVSEDSSKEDPEDLGLDLSLGEFFGSVGGEKLMKLAPNVSPTL